MDKIAILLRMAQLFAHNAHNLISGPSFFADHAFLGDLYPAYEDAYDAVVERMIGLGHSPDLIGIQEQAVKMLCAKSPEVKAPDVFKQIGNMEMSLRAQIDKEIPQCSEGSKQFLGGLADESEQRQYKLLQRVK